MTKLTLNIDPETIRQAKIRALTDGTSVSAAVAAFLDGWIAADAPGSDPEGLGHWDALQAQLRERDALLERCRALARRWADGEGEEPAITLLTQLARSVSAQDCVFDDVTVPADSVPAIAALAPEAFVTQAVPYFSQDEPGDFPQIRPETWRIYRAECGGTSEHGPHSHNGGDFCAGAGELRDELYPHSQDSPPDPGSEYVLEERRTGYRDADDFTDGV